MSETWTVDMRDVAIVLAFDYWEAREESDRLFVTNDRSSRYLRETARVDALAQAAGRMGLILEDLRPTEEEMKAATLRVRSAPGPMRFTK